jgi:hypothetical protein
MMTSVFKVSRFAKLSLIACLVTVWTYYLSNFDNKSIARDIVFLLITFLMIVSIYLIELAGAGNTNVIICILSINACFVSIY